MKFELYPTIDTMLDLYEQPRTFERFNEYIQTLQGNSKGDLVVPIAGFNPMAKEYAFQKLNELKSLKAEVLIAETISEINSTIQTLNGDTVFKVALNLADDKLGGWTHRYTTDYDSKFKLNALVKRGFCSPYFWTSEVFSAEIITARIKEYVYRTLFWVKNGKIQTLEEHINQERFVVQKTNTVSTHLEKTAVDFVTNYYNHHKTEEDYNIIFNFMYGDEICETLAYPSFGIKKVTGFDFAKL